MPIFKIKSGRHRPQWWWLRRLFALRFINTTSGKVRNVIFDQSWRMSDPDAWHKIVGFSNGFDHHWQSARWAARYDVEKDKMQLAAYIYNAGVRTIHYIGWVDFDRSTELYLTGKNNVFEGSYYYFELNRQSRWVDGKPVRYYQHQKLKKFGWFLGLYHGGPSPAPVDLILKSDKYL
jgi:hypothetical protein